ncbi:uncharacterized protein LOC122393640 [Amphibalanus amphitrite]|nr:uncharacterized protein LOC122372749 isoform X2 [Amphibalanus amphitrite]XP_043206247.1 uncharacterized protein LOC122372749 isoform X2 [Amphibalanus amphitrite]XP_043206254.1 uncharacterized protein LOC122372749 isoform X2 [Amphibalanus amphitrite]XP_043210671.1 uncharacterized protein LOC122375382 isoform X2 [Amphibalanus amphitrite]XP_043245793.1 uncharacterized protein LOC122393640 [Amphibalanus amphitrite]
MEPEAFRGKALGNLERLKELICNEHRCPHDRAIWHLAFLLGEDLDVLLAGRNVGIRMVDAGVIVSDEAQLIPEANGDVKLVLWVLAHMVFAAKFPSGYGRRLGSVLYNKVCGFRMQVTKVTERVLHKIYK